MPAAGTAVSVSAGAPIVAVMTSVEVRGFRAGDGADLAEAWTAAAPADPITALRLRDLILLDRNFDPDGLRIATLGGELVGAAYAVRRRIAVDGDDLEPGSGWVPFFFVREEHRGRGLGRRLMNEALDWLRGHGAETAFFSSYTPNYFLPGLDAERYPQAARLLESLGFARQYECVAMSADLTGYAPPPTILDKVAGLQERGYRFGTPSDDDLVDLIAVAHTFNPDWSRGIREAVLQGLGLDKIIIVRDPDGALLGWAMHGAYEQMYERFGPFGVLPASRGLGLGEALLHLTMQRMRAHGAHHAWFLWTGEDSPAGHLYTKTGYRVIRRFQVLRADLRKS